MENEKINITISIGKDIHSRIQDAIQYFNLSTIYEKEYETIRTEEDFIVGAIVNFLEYVELFPNQVKRPQITKQDKRPIKNTFKQYLRNNGIKQKDLAEAIGMDRATLSMIVNNNVQPSMESFIKLWSALNFPPLDEIIYREN